MDGNDMTEKGNSGHDERGGSHFGCWRNQIIDLNVPGAFLSVAAWWVGHMVLWWWVTWRTWDMYG